MKLLYKGIQILMSFKYCKIYYISSYLSQKCYNINSIAVLLFWVLLADFVHGFSVASCALKVVDFVICIYIRLPQNQIIRML